MKEPASKPLRKTVCATSTMLDLSQTRSNWENKSKSADHFKNNKSHATSSHLTYISDNGGLIQHVVVHPPCLAACGLIEAMLADGVDVPVHGGEHATPAEGPILLPGQSQVQLLLCGQVGSGTQDPVCVAVPLRI